MLLKNNIYFKLRPYGKITISYQIQLHVTFDGSRWVTSTGCSVNDLGAWDVNAQQVKKGYHGPRGESYLEINNTLRKCKEQMQMTFLYFEGNDIYPTIEQISTKYLEKMRGILPQKPPRGEKLSEIDDKKGKDFLEVFQLFITESKDKNAWTNATIEKMEALREDLLSFKKNIKFADLSDSGLTAFVRYLRDEKRLKTPRKKKEDRDENDADNYFGLKNSTISKKLGFLRWFLNWATDKGYNTNIAYKSFRPTLKQTQKKVIFLTKEELASIQTIDLSGDNAYLEPVRDVFLCCCFTGLRHSDIFNLRRSDVKEDHLEVTTIKTGDSINIELNKITRGILNKYKDVEFKDGKALPVIKNQPMNRDLKILCKLAGINEKFRIVSYKGNKRQEVVKEKWELVGTHTGRRTFIVNALSLGIPPNIVMKWTGHSDYKSMRPYIDIVDSIKASSMARFDSIL